MQTLTPLPSVAPRLYSTILVHGIELLQIDGHTLAASRSRPGRWYDLTSGECACEEFRSGVRCAHWRAAIRLHTPPSTPRSLRGVA